MFAATELGLFGWVMTILVVVTLVMLAISFVLLCWATLKMLWRIGDDDDDAA